MKKSITIKKKTRSTIHTDRREALNCGKRRRKKNKMAGTGSILTDSKFPLVRVTAARFGMRCSEDDWTLYWTDTFISAEACRAMLPHQRVNRFPGVSAFACKDLLAQNLNRLYNAFPNRYKIFPRTWCLPHDYASITAYGISYPKKTFIIKPARGAEGRGIYITKNLKLIKPQDRMICQVYISRPFLIDGFKFDLRVYALISSIDPLRIYVYNEGLTRFATKKYEEPSSSNMNDKFMHLTNYAVNRRSAFYVHDQKAGTKRSLSTINKWFAKKGFSVKLIWASIDDAIIKTVLVALPTLRRFYDDCFSNHVATPACFQLLGFDMILDHRMKPYVLEVNHSPNMGTPTSVDAEVKSKLLYDTFRLLNLQKDDRYLGEKLKRFRGHGDRPHRMYNNNQPTSTDNKLKAQLVRASMIWEKRHLGNYRKIYPNRNLKKYKSIVEYLDRLKWPSLHKLPPQKCSSDNTVSFAKAKKRRIYSGGSETALGCTKPKIEGTLDNREFADDLSTDSELNEEIKDGFVQNRSQGLPSLSRPESQKCSLVSSINNLSVSALNMNVLSKYNYIDRITYMKIENNKGKTALKTAKEEEESTSGSSGTLDYESAKSAGDVPATASSPSFTFQAAQYLPNFVFNRKSYG